MDIKVDTKNPMGWRISAAEECKLALRNLGFPLCNVVGSRGAHHASVFVPSDRMDEFETLIKDKTFVGTYRKFFFCEVWVLGNKRSYYNVSYSKNND